MLALSTQHTFTEHNHVPTPGVLLFTRDSEFGELLQFVCSRSNIPVYWRAVIDYEDAPQCWPIIIMIDIDDFAEGLAPNRLIESLVAARRSLIVALTSNRDINFRAELLEHGADDCLVKPLSYRELIARIHAKTRRLVIGEKTSWQNGSHIASTIEDWRDVPESDDDTEVPIKLSSVEWRILTVLRHYKGSVVALDKIAEMVWGKEVLISPEVVRTAVFRLRRKLMRTGDSQPTIITVRGVGLMLQDSQQQCS